jgi:hypothetical protein
VDQDLEVCALARSLPAGHLWLTDRYSIAYFCDIRPTYLYTPHGRQFYATRDADEARALLESSRVGLVTFSNSIQEWWPSTALHASLLQQTGDAPELRKRVGYWEAFLLIR